MQLKDILTDLYLHADFYFDDVTTIDTVPTQKTRVFFMILNQDSEVIRVGKISYSPSDEETLNNKILNSLNIQSVYSDYKISAFILIENEENKKTFEILNSYWDALDNEVKYEPKKLCSGVESLFCFGREIYSLLQKNIKLAAAFLSFLLSSYFIVLVLEELRIPLQAVLITPSLTGLVFGFFIIVFVTVLLGFFYIAPILLLSIFFIYNKSVAAFKNIHSFYQFNRIKISIHDIRSITTSILLIFIAILYLGLFIEPIKYGFVKMFPKQILFSKDEQLSQVLSSFYYDATGFPKKMDYKTNKYIAVGYDSSFIYGYRVDFHKDIERMNNIERKQLKDEICTEDQNISNNFWKIYRTYWKHTDFSPHDAIPISKTEILQMKPLSEFSTDLQKELTSFCSSPN